MKLFLLGAQGSGKGTVGKILAKRLSLPLVGVGEMLRDMLPSNPHYETIQKMMLEGKFNNQDIIAEILQDRLTQTDCSNGFLLDGWGRKKVDLELFDPQVDYAIYFVIPRELSVQRIIGRRICRNDDFSANIFSRKPKVDGKCDICGADLIQRPDDTEEAVNSRLNIFYSETIPVIDHYRNIGKLIEIPGEGPAEEVAEVTLSLLPHDQH